MCKLSVPKRLLPNGAVELTSLIIHLRFVVRQLCSGHDPADTVSRFRCA